MASQPIKIATPDYFEFNTETIGKALQLKENVAEVFTFYFDSSQFAERTNRCEFTSLFVAINEAIDATILAQKLPA